MEDYINKFNYLTGGKKISLRGFCRKCKISADTLYKFLREEDIHPEKKRVIEKGIYELKGGEFNLGSDRDKGTKPEEEQTQEGQIVKERFKLISNAVDVLANSELFGGKLANSIRFYWDEYNREEKGRGKLSPPLEASEEDGS